MTGMIVYLIVVSIWIYYEIKNAPEMPDDYE